MKNNILKLSKELISIKSPEKSLELVLSYLKEFTIERFENNGIKSALIYNSKKRPKKFKIILNGHLDVIPGKDSQYIPRITANKLYGTGSMDMKTNVACLVYAFKEVSNKIDYPLALQLTTDEEVGGFNGTKYQIEKGVRADFVLAGEPTNFDIVNKAKGVLWFKISTKGKSAHGAYPWKGENAIEKMNEFLNRIYKIFPNPNKERWVTTINLAKIETNNITFNKIPDQCTAWLDIRFIPEDEKRILSSIKNLMSKDFIIEIIEKEPSLLTEDNEFVKKLQNIGERIIKKDIVLRGANGTSDARHFAKVNCLGIEFGPIGGGIGSDNEWVDIRSLKKYYKILVDFLCL